MNWVVMFSYFWISLGREDFSLGEMKTMAATKTNFREAQKFYMPPDRVHHSNVKHMTLSKPCWQTNLLNFFMVTMDPSFVKFILVKPWNQAGPTEALYQKKNRYSDTRFRIKSLKKCSVPTLIVHIVSFAQLGVRTVPVAMPWSLAKILAPSSRKPECW